MQQGRDTVHATSEYRGTLRAGRNGGSCIVACCCCLLERLQIQMLSTLDMTQTILRGLASHPRRGLLVVLVITATLHLDATLVQPIQGSGGIVVTASRNGFIRTQFVPLQRRNRQGLFGPGSSLRFALQVRKDLPGHAQERANCYLPYASQEWRRTLVENRGNSAITEATRGQSNW